MNAEANFMGRTATSGLIRRVGILAFATSLASVLGCKVKAAHSTEASDANGATATTASDAWAKARANVDAALEIASRAAAQAGFGSAPLPVISPTRTIDDLGATLALNDGSEDSAAMPQSAALSSADLHQIDLDCANAKVDAATIESELGSVSTTTLAAKIAADLAALNADIATLSADRRRIVAAIESAKQP